MIKDRIAELEKELERERLALGYESEYNVIIIERYCSNIRGKLAILRELKEYVEGLENDVSTLAEGYGDGGEWIRNLKKSNDTLQKERDAAVELLKERQPSVIIKGGEREVYSVLTKDALLNIPEGLYDANRYHTDNEIVLHLSNRKGETIDIRAAQEKKVK